MKWMPLDIITALLFLAVVVQLFGMNADVHGILEELKELKTELNKNMA